MKDITYLRGSAFTPQQGGLQIITLLNGQGDSDRAFIGGVSSCWDIPKDEVLSWLSSHSERFKLGAVQLLPIGPNLIIANIVARHEEKLHYGGLTLCLAMLAALIEASSHTDIISVHSARIGCGHSGGEWTQVESLITSHLCEKDIPVFVYDLP